MAMALGNIMNMLSTGSMDVTDVSADTEVSPGVFWGELLGEVEQYSGELDLSTVDPAELAQQIAGFLEQSQVTGTNTNLSTDWLDSSERLTQQLSDITAGDAVSDEMLASFSGAISKEQGTEESFISTLKNMADTGVGSSQESMQFEQLQSQLLASDGETTGNDLSDTSALKENGATAGNLNPLMEDIGSSEWEDGLGDRIKWMAKSTPTLTSAELKLNPAHLGPLEIKIDMDNDQASISFSTQHASVKEAVEAAIPKLREMLSAQELNLDKVEVTQQQTDFSGNQTEAQSNGEQSASTQQVKDTNTSSEAGEEILENSAGVVTRVENGVLSYYV